MKRILTILFIGLSFALNAQIVKDNFAAWANVSVSNGTNSITITAFQGNPKAFDQSWASTDLAVGDIVWANCSRFVVTAKTGLQLTLSNPDNGFGAVFPLVGQRVGLTRETLISGQLMATVPQWGDGNAGSIAGTDNTLAACIAAHYEKVNQLALLNSSVDTAVIRTYNFNFVAGVTLEPIDPTALVENSEATSIALLKNGWYGFRVNYPKDSINKVMNFNGLGYRQSALGTWVTSTGIQSLAHNDILYVRIISNAVVAHYVVRNSDVKNVRIVPNVATLRTIQGLLQGETIELLGYYSSGDGGGQLLYWDATSTATDNGGTVFQVTTPLIATGRWLSVEKNSVNVLQFGAKADALGAATDNTVAFNNAIAASKTVYIPVLNSDYYLVDSIVLKSGLRLIGQGGRAIIQDKPSSSAKALIVVPSFVVTTDLIVENLQFNGHGSNTSKVGLFINTTQGAGDGYTSHSNFNNLAFVNFLGNSIWLRGGTNDYRNPLQQLTFRNLTINSGVTTNDVVRLTGQCSGVRFETGVIQGNNGLNRTFVIERHRNYDGSLSGNTLASFNIDFSAGFAFQKASVGIEVQASEHIVLQNTYFEECKKGAFFRDSYAACTMINTNFKNITNTGTGVCIETNAGGNATGGDLWITGVTIATADKFLTNDGSSCKTYINGSVVGTATGLTKQLNGNTGTLDMLGYQTAIVTSTANIDNIVTYFQVGEPFYIKAHAGRLKFTNAGNIRMPANKTFLYLEEGEMAICVKMDLAGGVGIIGGYNDVNSALQYTSTVSATVFIKDATHYIMNPATAVLSPSIDFTQFIGTEKGTQLELFFGGTITTGNTVWTNAPIILGMTTVGDVLPSGIKSGDKVNLYYDGANWRVKYFPYYVNPYSVAVISSANIVATAAQTAFTFVVSGVDATTVNTSRFEIYRNGILTQLGAGNDYTIGTVTSTNIPITWVGTTVVANDKFYLKIR